MIGTWVVVRWFLDWFSPGSHERLRHLSPGYPIFIWIQDIVHFFQTQLVWTSDSYLMGRSRTIGADNEMAGPPGGPDNAFQILFSGVKQIYCLLGHLQHLWGVLQGVHQQWQRHYEAPHGVWLSGPVVPVGCRSTQTRSNPPDTSRCWWSIPEKHSWDEYE